MSNKTETNQDIVLKYQKKIQSIKIGEFICTGLLLFTIVASLIVVVVIQFTTTDKSYETAAQICNTYTGIILGFVAMTVSLIGMILGFHNTKQTEESNLSTAVEFINLKNSIQEIAEIEKALSKTLDELERKTVDMEKFQTIEKRLDEISREMRMSFDRNKGSATNKSTTTTPLRTEEDMQTDE